MDLSIFLSKIIGVVMVLFAVAGLAKPKMLRDAIRNFDHESFARLIVGCIGLGAGVSLVVSHNIWEWSFRGLVTLFGWTALAKGGMYLLAPKQMHSLTKKMLATESKMRGFLIGCLVVGAYLAYKGFGY